MRCVFYGLSHTLHICFFSYLLIYLLTYSSVFYRICPTKRTVSGTQKIWSKSGWEINIWLLTYMPCYVRCSFVCIECHCLSRDGAVSHHVHLLVVYCSVVWDDWQTIQRALSDIQSPVTHPHTSLLYDFYRCQTITSLNDLSLINYFNHSFDAFVHTACDSLVR